MSDKLSNMDVSYLSKFKPIQVKIRNGDHESAFRAFKSIVQKEKVLSLYKQKQFFEKPSEKKRRKRREAQDRRNSTASKLRLIESGEWEKRMQKKLQQKESD